MTSPLQQAFEASQAEQAAPTREPIVCTVAGPRVPFSSQSYTGAELRATSMRPGAYDALALPSVFNGRRVSRPAAAVNFVHTSGRVDFLSMKAPERRFTVVDTASESGAYLPKPGSVPSMVLAHLKEHGGHLTYSDLKERFGLPQSSVTAVFKKALDCRVLVRHVVNQRAAFALPGYLPPPDAPKPSKDLLVLKARLEKRRLEVAQLEREVADLQDREHLRSLITK